MAVNLGIYSNGNASSRSISVDFVADFLASSSNGMSEQTKYFFKFTTGAKDIDNNIYGAKVSESLNDLVLNKENQSTILHEVNHVIQKHNLNIRITYNIQEFPEHRSKPWGTADAIVSAKSHIHNPFLLVNSDDLYDAKTFELVQEECDFSKNYIIGFKLGTTLTSNNKANRAFISLDQDNGHVNELQEKLNIEKANYTEEELNNQYVSVNLFLLQPEVLSIMEAELNVFKHANRDSDTIEAMLPDFLNFHIKHGEINMELLKSCGTWNGVTYKEDVEQVRDILSKCI